MSTLQRPYGDCYEASLESAEELVQIKEWVESDVTADETLKEIYQTLDLTRPITVVHGTAVPSDGLDEGRTIIHAWVEVGDTVVETSNKQMLPLSRGDYYARHGAKPLRRYTAKEARALAIQHGYKPWHVRLET